MFETFHVEIVQILHPPPLSPSPPATLCLLLGPINLQRTQSSSASQSSEIASAGTSAGEGEGNGEGGGKRGRDRGRGGGVASGNWPAQVGCPVESESELVNFN